MSASYAIFDSKKEQLKHDGLAALKRDKRESAEQMLKTLGEYGCFVVPVGEVESWLKELEIEGKKTRWLIRAFERLGSNPKSKSYIEPSAGDVWAFLGEVGRWIADPNRKGMGSTRID